LQNKYAYTVVFNSSFFPKNPVFETVHHIFAGITVSLFLSIISLVVYYKLKNIQNFLIPSQNITVLNIMELFYETLSKIMHDILGKHFKQHLPFVGSFALFILFSNLLGLIPGFSPSTNNLNTTLACGFIVFIYFNYYGFKVNVIKHITHLANPMGVWWGWFLAPLFFPIELVGVFVRPFSLAIRLAGNLIGDHSVILAFVGLMPILLPLPFMFFGFLVCIIQTFIFCLLTCVYISMHTVNSH